MAELTKSEMLKITDENISKLKNKTFKIFFFILDTKGNPSSALEYIYQTALVLSKKGYDVTMLHQEKDFVGVGDWLGKEYAELKHSNIETDNVEIGPCDFIFIPEIFANVMIQTKTLSCKRVAIVQNAYHVTEFLPISHTFDTVNIIDAVVTTKGQENRIKEYFPTLRTHIVSPSIKKVFRDNETTPRKMIINVICKDQSEMNRIVKPFYWKNPEYKWVSFRELRGLSQETFAEALREAAITIWDDDSTTFGYSLLEALRCGGIVLAKVPNELSDWMVKDGEISKSVLWFNNVDELSNILPNVVQTWITDKVPAEVHDGAKETFGLYSEEAQEKEIEEVYVKGFFERRLKEFEEVRIDVENNVIKAKEE